jgi:nucleoside-diphosphate-sugar epimerase
MTAADPVLVTGAMGQLGRRLVALLLERGRTVVALDLDSPATRTLAEGLKPAPGQPGTLLPAFVNLLDPEGLRSLLARQRPRAILHLAAMVAPPCYKNPKLARRVNVEGTRNLVQAAQALSHKPLFVFASSCSVYGSRNPHRHAGRLTAATPVNPVDCYGEDKVLAERIVAASGLPQTILRLGGILSPDLAGSTGPEYMVLMRATPRDNRIHAVDARDAALAFANAADRRDTVDGKVLLIGGNETYVRLEYEVEDAMTEALGLGRLGSSAGLPGDPRDERGWGLTDWFDTADAQAVLDFQRHDFSDTVAWVAGSQGRRRLVLRLLGPLLRPALRSFLAAQRRAEKRGPYADPWTLISGKYGVEILASGAVVGPGQ